VERRELLGIGLDVAPFSAFVERITALARDRQSAYVCLVNAHMTVEASRDPGFAAVVVGADLAAPDGMPLVGALRLLYGVVQERVAGVDLMAALLESAEREGVAVFFYGEAEPVLEAVVARARRDFPRLQLAGALSPPFRALSAAEQAQHAAQIEASGARLVLVALGCPKQERWMAGQKGSIRGVMVGLGGAFAVYAGLRSRAPAWMRRHSLEWLYRLLQEPGRLWRRYLMTNTLFLLLLSRQWWAGRHAGNAPPRG
jgi:N-acetylglucosaminyldiphosphoundecaprenol N-acetyl-beta-D-mannosaminyltransferase